jgi:hypothetical protein
MSENLLSQLDKLAGEVEDATAVIDKLEKFQVYNKWVQERHEESNVLMEINRYQEILSVDPDGTVIKADNLLQIRYTDSRKSKKKPA